MRGKKQARARVVYSIAIDLSGGIDERKKLRFSSAIKFFLGCIKGAVKKNCDCQSIFFKDLIFKIFYITQQCSFSNFNFKVKTLK